MQESRPYTVSLYEMKSPYILSEEEKVIDIDFKYEYLKDYINNPDEFTDGEICLILQAKVIDKLIMCYDKVLKNRIKKYREKREKDDASDQEFREPNQPICKWKSYT